MTETQPANNNQKTASSNSKTGKMRVIKDFAKRFNIRFGRYPTRKEVMAELNTVFGPDVKIGHSTISTCITSLRNESGAGSGKAHYKPHNKLPSNTQPASTSPKQSLGAVAVTTDEPLLNRDLMLETFKAGRLLLETLGHEGAIELLNTIVK